MLTVDSSCCCPSCPTCCPHWFHFVSRKLLQPVSSKISFPLLTSITHPLSLSNYRHLDSSTSTLLIGYTWRDYHSIGGKKNSSKWPTSTCPLLPLSDPVSHSISNTEHRSWEEEYVAREEERIGEREGQWTDEPFSRPPIRYEQGPTYHCHPQDCQAFQQEGCQDVCSPIDGFRFFVLTNL